MWQSSARHKSLYILFIAIGTMSQTCAHWMYTMRREIKCSKVNSKKKKNKKKNTSNNIDNNDSKTNRMTNVCNCVDQGKMNWSNTSKRRSKREQDDYTTGSSTTHKMSDRIQQNGYETIPMLQRKNRMHTGKNSAHSRAHTHTLV